MSEEEGIDSWMLPVDISLLALVSLWWFRRVSQQQTVHCQQEKRLGVGLAVCLMSTVLSQVASIPFSGRYMLGLWPVFWTPSLVILYYIAQCLEGNPTVREANDTQAFPPEGGNPTVTVLVATQALLSEGELIKLERKLNESELLEASLWSSTELGWLSDDTVEWGVPEGEGGAEEERVEEAQSGSDTDTDSLASTVPDMFSGYCAPGHS
jgi:hypothetical protein